MDFSARYRRRASRALNRITTDHPTEAGSVVTLYTYHNMAQNQGRTGPGRCVVTHCESKRKSKNKPTIKSIHRDWYSLS